MMRAHTHTHKTLPFHLVLQHIHKQRIINKNAQRLRIPKTTTLAIS